MYPDEALVERFVRAALKALRRGSEDNLAAVLDALPAPAYVTNASGTVTHFNDACINFSGRTPRAGEDKWCVTWRLFTEQGDALPHDQCPMAQAIQQKKPMRGAVAIALRPDGSKATFKPFPTPLLDGDGNLLGAVNVFLDLTLESRIVELLRQARVYRRRAARATDDKLAATYEALADECEAVANNLENPN